MKKTIAIGTVAIFLAACGDEVTEVNQINQIGMEVVKSAKDLPKCTDDNEGELAFVKGETAVRVCVDGEWEATSQSVKDTVYLGSDVSCKTEELKDKSGLKIVCNGDSIGVVLNGKDGEKGEDGEDGKDAVLPNDTLEADSERVPILLDSLVGYTQKGPFLKGSTVYLYELSDGRTLKQTNGNFTSNIARDDGRYKFNARDLVSQYAMVVVDGYYRNEVTGVSSDAPIRLKAITDMRKHSSVNVNILTHLEFERVYHLVTRDHKTVKAAKRQAQEEILNLFHIRLDKETDAEDMDVFGNSDADAALLAISILLQGKRTESELMALLSEISNAIVENGKWEGDRADTIKAQMADWVAIADTAGKLAEYRSHVGGWGLGGGNVPHFEKYVRMFWSGELRLGLCGNKDNPVGTVKHVSNPNSTKFYAKKYDDTMSIGGKIRFTCVDADSAKWRVAEDLEKDRFGWNPDNTKDGSLLNGQVTGRKMVWDKDTLRYANDLEIDGGKGCTNYNRDELYILGKQYSYYKCMESGWKFTLEKLNIDSISYGKQTYKTIGIKTQNWMAENLNYEVEGQSYCYDNSLDSCAKYGRLYTWAAAVGKTEEECGYGKNCELPDTVRGVCPKGWHLPSNSEWSTLYSAIDNSYYAMQAKGFANWISATDDYGFSALPAGRYYLDERNMYNGRFVDVGSMAYFWTSSENYSGYTDSWTLFDSGAYFGNEGKYMGFSVRCVMDSAE